MWMIFIPIATIVIIFLVYYIFKSKFQNSKHLVAYNEAQKRWTEEHDAVVKEMFDDENCLKMLQTAVGDAKIEGICPCEPKKSFGKKLLKGGLEILTAHQSFDMSLYYLVVAGGELHLLQSDGDMIVAHDAFTLANLSEVDIRPEGKISKVMNFLTTDNSPSNNPNSLTVTSRASIFFTSKGEKYSYKLLDGFEGFPKFSVQKGYTNGKRGQNPFSRSFPAPAGMSLQLGFYGSEAIKEFNDCISKIKQQNWKELNFK